VSNFDDEFYNQNKGDFDYPKNNIVKYTTTTLTKILDSLSIPNIKIDLLIINVEGNDFKVLKG
jgi:sortase (surface protein transpeptidase)